MLGKRLWGGTMQTADWALVISLCSFGVSLAAFVWNVWSKFIYPKPQVQVAFRMMTIVQGGSADESILSLSATKHGADRGDVV